MRKGVQDSKSLIPDERSWEREKQKRKIKEKGQQPRWVLRGAGSRDLRRWRGKTTVFAAKTLERESMVVRERRRREGIKGERTTRERREAGSWRRDLSGVATSVAAVAAGGKVGFSDSSPLCFFIFFFIFCFSSLFSLFLFAHWCLFLGLLFTDYEWKKKEQKGKEKKHGMLRSRWRGRVGGGGWRWRW